MPVNNSLNVSELMKRLGVVGDSLGSAPLLEAMRLSVNLADLSDLVAPLPVPMAGVESIATSVGGTHNQWNIQCLAPGGLRVFEIESQSAALYNLFITSTNPFGAPIVIPQGDLVSGQPTLSIFSNYVAAAPVAPAGHFGIRGSANTMLQYGGWVAPGDFFNIEAESDSQTQQLCSIVWKEYPGMISP